MNLAACDEPCTACHRIRHMLDLLFDGSAIDEGADIGIAEPGPDPHGSDLVGEGLDETIIDGPLDVEAVCGKAILTGGSELCRDRMLHGALKIAIGKSDERGVPAKLHDEALNRRGRLAVKEASHFG